MILIKFVFRMNTGVLFDSGFVSEGGDRNPFSRVHLFLRDEGAENVAWLLEKV
jgi:hypothetical protein